jgi:hypothetical protein
VATPGGFSHTEREITVQQQTLCKVREVLMHPAAPLPSRTVATAMLGKAAVLDMAAEKESRAVLSTALLC